MPPGYWEAFERVGGRGQVASFWKPLHLTQFYVSATQAIIRYANLYEGGKNPQFPRCVLYRQLAIHPDTACGIIPWWFFGHRGLWNHSPAREHVMATCGSSCARCRAAPASGFLLPTLPRAQENWPRAGEGTDAQPAMGSYHKPSTKVLPPQSPPPAPSPRS